MAVIKPVILAVALVIVAAPVTSVALDSRQLAEELLEAPTATAGKKGILGIASYYATRFNGRKTNSGERHDPALLTAAHAHLPLGSKVLVKNITNDKEVVVTVNDRCRKRRTPFIDLSREAARRLGFLGRGTARVKMFVLGRS